MQSVLGEDLRSKKWSVDSEWKAGWGPLLALPKNKKLEKRKSRESK